MRKLLIFLFVFLLSISFVSGAVYTASLVADGGYTSAGGNTATGGGIVFTVGADNIWLLNIHSGGDFASLNVCTLYDDNGAYPVIGDNVTSTILNQADGSANFNYTFLYNSSVYYILCQSPDGTRVYKDAGAWKPFASDKLTVTASLEGSNDVRGDAIIFNVREINYTDTPPASAPIIPAPFITVLSPANGTYQNNRYWNITFNTTGAHITSVSLWTNQSGAFSINQSNTTIILNDSTSINVFNFSLVPESALNFSLSICDNNTNCSYTLNRTIFTDLSAPTISSNISLKNYTNLQDTYATFTDNLRLNNVSLNKSCTAWSYAANTSNITYSYSSMGDSIAVCSLGLQYLYGYSCDKAGNCNSSAFSWYAKGYINVTGKSLVTGAALNSFSVYKDGVLDGSTTNGTYLVENLDLGNYSILFSAPGYTPESKNVTVASLYTGVFFEEYTNNALNIRIRNELNNQNVTENVSIKFTSSTQEFTNYTITSAFYIDELTPATYQLLFTAGNFTPRAYTVTVGNLTAQNLDVFLTNSTSTVLFTIIDKDTGTALNNVLASMYRMINGSWTPVESHYSDITGKAQFSYQTETNYKFYMAKSSYSDYIFYLNPILFATYDVKMSKSSLINYSQDYDKLSIIYSPQIFKNNNVTTFNWVIATPYGILTDYGYTLTYPGGTGTITGNNAIGEQLTLNATIVNAGVFDVVELDYWYITTISGRRNFSINLPIINNLSKNTFMTNVDKTYGLGTFERILIATFIVMLIVGIATMIGQPIPGLALGLFIFGYMVYIGFVPIWFVLPSMFIGVFFLVWKSGGT